jgi:hypothetical protein
VYVARLIVGGLLGVISCWVITLNWSVFAQGYLLRRKTSSWIPLIGGVAGVATFLVLPIDDIHKYWWLPLLADWGCIPGLLHALLFHAFVRRR